MVETLPGFLAGEITLKPQVHEQATFTKKFASADAEIPSGLITSGGTKKELLAAEAKVRALNPEPGTWTTLERLDRSKAVQPLRIKITSAKIENEKLVPTRVVPAGKKEMSWEDFLRGNSLA